MGKKTETEDRFSSLRLGEILIECGYATKEQIKKGLACQKSDKKLRLGQALINLGIITERQMLDALGKRLGLKVESWPEVSASLEAAEKLPKELAFRYRMLPVKAEDGILTVLTNDPLNFYGLEDIRQITGMDVELKLCETDSLMRGIRYSYTELSARQAAASANQGRPVQEKITIKETGDKEAGETPVVNLFRNLLQRACQNQASDIHIEPFEDQTIIRMRIDGAMAEFVTLQKSIHQPLIARIKILGNMDIAERRLPQDGHFQMEENGEQVSVRVSIMPTIYGEKAVIRLLGLGGVIDHPDTFGMDVRDYRLLQHMLAAPNGLIYLTGPTGSGKTTTLYLVLEALAGRPVNICTIEDPVEKKLEKVNQCQVNVRGGITFEKGLRALLRQDPDIIMVGETRDSETAAISVRAAITGHLVLSTLHTNDAVSSIMRLEDMGIAPYLLAGSLTGIVAQRLMRRLCPACARLKEGEQAGKYRKEPAGCALCGHTGYRGRVAIHEIFTIDRQVRRMIAQKAPSDEIREYAVRKQGMRTLRECGMRLVEQGITSMEELEKVVYYDEWDVTG